MHSCMHSSMHLVNVSSISPGVKKSLSWRENLVRPCLPSQSCVYLVGRAVTQKRTTRAYTREPPSYDPQATRNLPKKTARKKAYHMNQMMWGLPQQSIHKGYLSSTCPSETLGSWGTKGKRVSPHRSLGLTTTLGAGGWRGLL